MANRCGNLSKPALPPEIVGDTVPAYRRIADGLRALIRSGGLAAGSILLEGPLSTHVGTSRAPVRQALGLLEAEGLLARFDGRGMIVPGAAPLRGPLDLSRLAPIKPASQSTDAYYALERQLVLHSLLGPARLNELSLARALGRGRAATHELLLSAERNGIVARGARGTWLLVPLTAQRLDDLYALRELIEPAAVACVDAPDALIARMLRNLDEAGLQEDPPLDRLDRLEVEMHVELLAFARNPELVEALRRTRVLLFAGKHMQRAVGRVPDSFVEEHKNVLEALRRGDPDCAARCLHLHLAESRRKGRDRLDDYHDITEREDWPVWLIPTA